MNSKSINHNVWSLNLVVGLAALLLLSNFAIATVPLDTGYDHSTFSPYPVPGSTPIKDQYWINIASAPNVPAGPAWLLVTANGWAMPFGTLANTGTRTSWISARPTVTSPPGTADDNPGYTIFRKCFCLLPNFKDANLKFEVRADDSLQVWLNTQLNPVLSPSSGNYNPQSTALSGFTKKGFVVGRNCIYVLVEDVGGQMGFDLKGDVTATGLLELPAAGTAGTFEPCACQKRDVGHSGGKSAMNTMSVDEDDQQVVQEIVKIAEARRKEKQRTSSRGIPPKLERSLEAN